MTTATEAQTTDARLRAISRRVIRARLGTLDSGEAERHYADDCAALLALLDDAREVAVKSRRAIRIEERLRIK
jgi:hypothetical protein